MLLELADDFVDNVVVMSSLLARHRRSVMLDVRDVQLHLDQHWGMRVAGFFQPEDSLPSTVRRPMEEEGKEEETAAAGGGRSRGGKADLAAAIPGLQKLRPVKRTQLSEGHRRRLHLVHMAKQVTDAATDCSATLTRSATPALLSLLSSLIFPLCRVSDSRAVMRMAERMETLQVVGVQARLVNGNDPLIDAAPNIWHTPTVSMSAAICTESMAAAIRQI